MTHPPNNAGSHGPNGAAGPSSAPDAAARGSDEVFAVLSEFEQGLANLKSLYSQRQSLIADIQAQERTLASRESEVSAKLGEAAKAEEQLRSWRGELESMRAAIERRDAELAARESAIAAAAAEAQNRANKTQAELAAEKASVEESRRSLAADRAAQERLFNEMQSRATDLDQRQREYEAALKRAQEASDEAATARQGVSVAQEELDAVRTELGTSEATVAELRQQLAMTAEQMARAQAQARERSATAETLAGKLKQLQADLESARKAKADAETSAQAGSASAAQLTAKVSSLQARADEAAALAAARDAAESARNAAEARAKELNDKLASAVRTIADMQANAAAQPSADPDELAGIVASLKNELASSTAHEAELATKVRELERSLRESERAAAAGTGAGDGSPRGVSATARRRRLRVYRDAVHRQAEKVRRAGEAVKRRMEQAEQVLAHRADVAAARQRIIDAERRLQRAKATGRTTVGLLCSLVMVGLLGAMSWALAMQFAPATFVATAQIKADGRGRDLTGPELDEWKTFHETLLGDPRFHETAAERFKRQGVENLSTASAVADLIKSSCSVRSSNPGELTIELRAQGAARSERTLDVLAGAWASEANEAQQRRAEGSVTQVSVQSKAGADPIDNTRLVWALGMLGAGVVGTGLVGLLVWSRLAHAKTAFERDTSFDEVLNAQKWPDMAVGPGAASARRAGTKGSAAA